MEIYINTNDNCILHNNMWILPTLKDIKKIEINLNKMKEEVANIKDLKKYNDIMFEKNIFTPINIIKDNKGFIYIIKQWEYYKIGRTLNVKNRYRKYITENPEECTLIYSYKTDDYINEEQRLHKEYKDKHYRGEWFKLDEQDIYTIKNLSNEI